MDSKYYIPKRFISENIRNFNKQTNDIIDINSIAVKRSTSSYASPANFNYYYSDDTSSDKTFFDKYIWLNMANEQLYRGKFLDINKLYTKSTGNTGSILLKGTGFMNEYTPDIADYITFGQNNDLAVVYYLQAKYSDQIGSEGMYLVVTKYTAKSVNTSPYTNLETTDFSDDWIEEVILDANTNTRVKLGFLLCPLAVCAEGGGGGGSSNSYRSCGGSGGASALFLLDFSADNRYILSFSKPTGSGGKPGTKSTCTPGNNGSNVIFQSYYSHNLSDYYQVTLTGGKGGQQGSSKTLPKTEPTNQPILVEVYKGSNKVTGVSSFPGTFQSDNVQIIMLSYCTGGVGGGTTTDKDADTKQLTSLIYPAINEIPAKIFELSSYTNRANTTNGGGSGGCSGLSNGRTESQSLNTPGCGGPGRGKHAPGNGIYGLAGRDGGLGAGRLFYTGRYIT